MDYRKPESMVYILLVLLANVLLFVSIQLLRKKQFISQFLARKLLHIISCLGVLVAYLLIPQVAYILICLFFVAFYAIVTHRKMSLIESPRYQSYGAPLLPLGLTVLALTLWNNPVLHTTGVLLLAFPDTLSVIAERYVPRHNRINHQLVKPAVYALLALGILLVGHPLLIALLLSVLLTVVEALSPKGSDNVTVPSVYALAILLSNGV